MRHRPVEQPAAEPLRILQADAARAFPPVAAGEELAARRVVQIDAEIIGQHELHAPHHVLRPRPLPHENEAAARGDRVPVDLARVEQAGLVGPVGQDLQPLVRDHARAARGGVAGALADQILRQVPIGVERGIADQARHFRRRHGALADHDQHRILDPAVLDHPEPGRGGVDENVAALDCRNGAGALDIGEDQPLVKGRAAVERGERRAVRSSGDGQPMGALEVPQDRRGVRIGGEAEALAKLLRPACGDRTLWQARPASAIGGQAPDEAVIGRIAGEAGARIGGRGGGRGQGVEQGAVLSRCGGEAGIDIAHRVARGWAGPVAGRVEKGLAQHHVGPQPGAVVARLDGVERGDDVGARGQQVEQGLVGAVCPDGLEVALGIERQQVRPGLERCGHVRASRGRAHWRRLWRGAVGRDGPEAESEAGGAQEMAQGRHGCKISEAGGQVQQREGRNWPCPGLAQRNRIIFPSARGSSMGAW